ncbi:hypothetical protein HL42_0952 [Trichophyton rubrum]|nr:hypothetical protein HL42_0952 [Trichophyton rubrum]
MNVRRPGGLWLSPRIPTIFEVDPSAAGAKTIPMHPSLDFSVPFGRPVLSQRSKGYGSPTLQYAPYAGRLDHISTRTNCRCAQCYFAPPFLFARAGKSIFKLLCHRDIKISKRGRKSNFTS